MANPEVTEFITAEQIAHRVAELAADLSRDYHDQDLLMVGVLKGAFIFLADLVRHMTIAPAIDFLRVASYGTETTNSGVVEIRKDIETSIAGKHVLLVEDIIDTGLTLQYLLRHFAAAGPASVRVCTLLDKPSQRQVPITGDYVGFSIGSHYVVGYGLDFAEQYRHLPGIYILSVCHPMNS